MANLRKKAIMVAVTAVLGLQVATQVIDTGGRFWPFMPYHMYSQVYSEGTPIVLYELRVAAGEAAFRTVPSAALGLSSFRLQGLLAAAATGQGSLFDSGEDGGLRYLTASLAALDRYESAQLWEHRYEIDSEGLRSRIPERSLVLEWTMPMGSSR